MPVFAPTTDVSSSSPLTWHFLLHSVPPFSRFSFPCFSPRLQSEGNDRQKNSALPSVPSLLEVLGFSYFYGGFLVGPQFTLLRYQQLVNRELTDCRGKPPSRSETQSNIAKVKWTQRATAHTPWKIIRIYNVSVYLLPALSHYSSTSVVPAMKRFALGFFYLVVFAVFSTYYQDSYFTTDEFEVRLCPYLTLTTMFCMSLSQLQFQSHVLLRRPSLSGTAVFIFWFGEKSVCINMSAAGWLR